MSEENESRPLEAQTETETRPQQNRGRIANGIGAPAAVIRDAGITIPITRTPSRRTISNNDAPAESAEGTK